MAPLTLEETTELPHVMNVDGDAFISDVGSWNGSINDSLVQTKLMYHMATLVCTEPMDNR